VTPFGGLSLFIEFLGRIGYHQQVSEHLPVHLRSPNAIDPAQTFTAFLIAVLAGARRFAHTWLLRADRALHVLLGMERFPTDGTIRNLFKRFTQGMVVRFYEPLWAWVAAATRGCPSAREATVWTSTRRCLSAMGNRNG
jgi:hypothetical protein